MKHRITVSVTDHFRQRLARYCERHGASMAAALVALASRALDADDETAYRAETGAPR